MDVVFIRGLEIQAIIGIYEWEREHRQRIIIDIEMASDIKNKVDQDDIDQALNYKTVTERVTELVSSSSFQLVETLAESIAQLIQTEFGVQWLKLSVGKPEALDNVDCVGVVIERQILTTGKAD